MDKEKSSRRIRDDRDRDLSKDHHRHRDRDRDGESRHHHRDRDADDRRRDSDHYHHHHRSSRREDRESSRERESKRERSYDRRDEREGSRDRARDRDSKRERSREREWSVDREMHQEMKREGSHEGREEKKEKEGRSKRKDREDENEMPEGEKKARVSDGRSERRRFEDSAKDDVRELDNVSEVNGKEVKEVAGAANEGSALANGKLSFSASMASDNLPESSLVPSQLPSSKVSSISTTNENKGVSIARSHEVPGKSSTDGTSSTAGKSSANLSLDALTKAKIALQKQKELKEKLKKIPLLNKDSKSTSEASPHTGVLVSAPVTATATSTLDAGAASSSSALPASTQPFSSASGLTGLGTIPNIEAVKRAQELAAKMGFRQDPEFAPLINLFPGQVPTEVVTPQKPTKAPVLRVDALGREIDEHGNVVNVTKPSNLSTLKVNINKQKKDSFQILKPQLDVDPESNPHFDPRMGINKNKLLRPKRMSFQFVEEGKWTKDAENLKLKSQFGEAKAKELKAKQAHLAKVKADINPNLIEVSERVIPKEKPKVPIPEVEWWDANILINGMYGDIADGSISEDQLKLEKITIYVEHPRPIEPPAEAAPPPPQPLKLTKKEQKKLRTQRRLAREKEKQEMIRQGLLEPPKPKVKMSNLMKVLGSEATQDPTRLEKEIRTSAAEREQAHIDRNTARKLTPAERREKKERKLFDDPNTVETIVSVYKINELSHPKARFKVDMNARENRLTGCAVISEGMTVVVVEGGSKSIKRYGKLMLRRINWEEAVKEGEKEEEEEEEEKPPNKCVLVWQGSVAKPSFNRFYIHECLTETAARKVFADAGVGHYWDLAANYSEE